MLRLVFVAQRPGRTRPVRSLRMLLAALALLLAACAARAPLPADLPRASGMVQGVPFHPQGEGECGPSSLAGILNFWGDPVTPEEIAGAVMRENLRGSTTLDLILYPRGRGFASRFYDGSVADIVRSIDAGRPLMVMIDYGFGPVSANHFLVVTGYAPDFVRVNSGVTPAQQWAWTDFLPRWERTGRWTLAVVPKENTP